MQWRAENPGVALRAIHVHHGLSANANTGLRIAKTSANSGRCRWWSSACNLRKKDWAFRPQARQARYQAFARTLLPGEVLVTAQHLDDQCETFLLALKRGSGLAGLSAMGKSRSLPEHGYPPLLARTRGNWSSGHWRMVYAGLKTKVIRTTHTI
ncbi:ATP-binding protein [Shigella flexneri]